MKKNKLGLSSLEVSKVCLGTMTFGEQNNQDEAYAQMDYAIENDINFLTLLKCIQCQVKQQPKVKLKK